MIFLVITNSVELHHPHEASKLIPGRCIKAASRMIYRVNHTSTCILKSNSDSNIYFQQYELGLLLTFHLVVGVPFKKINQNTKY